MILEGWSAAVVMHDVDEIYHGLTKGASVRLEPALPYSAYIHWLRQLDSTPTDAYWQKTLQGFSEPNHLPMDKAQGDAPPKVAHCAELRWRMSAQATQALNRFAKESRLTVATIFLGAWALMLGRYTRSGDVVFGAVVSGRSADLPGVESMVGLCVNTLPARVRVDADSRLVPWLQALQREQAELRNHEHSSIVQAQAFSDVPHGQPLFESLVAFQNWAGEIPHAGGDWLGEIKLLERRAHEASDYPLALMIEPGPQLLAVLRYDPQRFQEDAIARMQGHLDKLLGAFVAEPDRSLGEFTITTPQEREQLLVDWNRTASDYPREASIAALFEDQAELAPGAVAVVFGEESLSYRELDERANRLATHLVNLGVGPGVVVGLCVERSLEMVVALLGILKACLLYTSPSPRD